MFFFQFTIHDKNFQLQMMYNTIVKLLFTVRTKPLTTGCSSGALLLLVIKWPEREMLRKTLPACFKQQYSRATCIIDCSEIFIQRPTSLTARSQTYSNYKSHNTVKFLIAISPTGAIIFVLVQSFLHWVLFFQYLRSLYSCYSIGIFARYKTA